MLFVVLGTHSNKNVKEKVWPDLDFLASSPLVPSETMTYTLTEDTGDCVLFPPRHKPQL